MIRLSVNKRVLLWIVAINALVVGAETGVLARQISNRSRLETEALADDLVYTLRATIQSPTGRERVRFTDEFDRTLRERAQSAAPRLGREAADRAARALVARWARPRPGASATGRLGDWWRAQVLRALFVHELQGELGETYERESAARSRATAEVLVSDAIARLLPGGGLSVGPLLAWPSWDRFEDAILLDRNVVRQADGRVVSTGVALNPLGRDRRRGDLDEQRVYSAIADVVASGQPMDGVEGGKVVPVVGEDGLFGACWYVQPPVLTGASLFWRYVLPAFLFSTLLLSLGTFVALRRFVLEPVERLTRASRKVAAGDLSARVATPHGRDELGELARTFNEMSARVESFNVELADEVERATRAARRAQADAMTQRRLAAMGELAAGIAHEINNPLGGLMNAVEVLGREELAPERRARYLELLQGGLERMRTTVGELLRFTPRSASPEPFALARPLLDAVSLVRHRAGQLGVSLVVSDGTQSSSAGEVSAELEASLYALPPVLGEAHEMAQAVLNLLVNSLDALEEQARAGAPGARGRIDVELRRGGAGLRLEVRDDGPGVAADVLERASDLYFTTKAPGRGTGLGLALVHKIVSAHGGRVELTSQPGAGFQVVLEIPIHPTPGQPAGSRKDG